MPQVNSRFTERRPWEEINETDKQEVIRALALGYTLRQAAKIVKRQPAIVFQWARTDPGFAAALNAIAADRDDEVTDFNERVRRAAATMLDNLLEIADRRDPITDLPLHSERERNNAIKTFFGELHGPMMLPRTPAQAAQPVVMLQAHQANFLINAPHNGDSHGGRPAEVSSQPPPHVLGREVSTAGPQGGPHAQAQQCVTAPADAGVRGDRRASDVEDGGA